MRHFGVLLGELFPHESVVSLARLHGLRRLAPHHAVEAPGIVIDLQVPLKRVLGFHHLVQNVEEVVAVVEHREARVLRKAVAARAPPLGPGGQEGRDGGADELHERGLECERDARVGVVRVVDHRDVSEVERLQGGSRVAAHKHLLKLELLLAAHVGDRRAIGAEDRLVVLIEVGLEKAVVVHVSIGPLEGLDRLAAPIVRRLRGALQRLLGRSLLVGAHDVAHDRRGVRALDELHARFGPELAGKGVAVVIPSLGDR